MTILSRGSSLWSLHWFWWKLETCRVLSDSSLKETHNAVVHNKTKRQRCHLCSTKSLLGRSCFCAPRSHRVSKWSSWSISISCGVGFQNNVHIEPMFQQTPTTLFLSRPRTVSVAEGEKIPTNQIKQMIFREAIDHPSCSTGLTGRS